MCAGSTGAKKGSLGPRVPSKMPMVRHTNNHWYRARVLREDTKRVQIGVLVPGPLPLQNYMFLSGRVLV